MDALFSLIAVLAIAALGYLGGEVGRLRVVFGVLIPYAAFAVFLAGLLYRAIQWAWTPVPFRIPVTCGQQKSLPWIKAAWIENPSTRFGVFVRMALEVLLFRSLFRNTRAGLREGPRLVYSEDKFLWLGALAFHWSLLIILIRHLRFFLLPVPGLISVIDGWDGFFRVGAPVLYMTDAAILLALAYLLGRRFWEPKVRYLSLLADYFALYLLIGIALSGVLMRYVLKVDAVGVKEWALGLAAFSPNVPASVGPLFLAHLTLVSALAAYFPFSKLLHAAGTFLSPTHNLASDNRMKRHVNPWNYPVKVHTYEEWENEFRDKIRAAGLPLEKE